MLEDYLAFAKGDGGEEAAPTNVGELLEEVNEETLHYGTPIEIRMRQPSRDLVLPLKRQAFKRAVTNLVTNAARFGDYVVIRAGADEEWLRIEVDDDGPGIPPAERDNVFRPFYRLGNGRNQDMRQHRARASPSPATSPAATAATSRSASRPWAACARRCACRCKSRGQGSGSRGQVLGLRYRIFPDP